MYINLAKFLNVRKFSRNEDGSIAILAGISFVFVVMIIAVSIDIAEVYRARVNFNNALDAGTLAATKVVAATKDKVAAQIAGERVFLANLGNLDPSKGAFTVESPTGGCGGGMVVGKATLDHRVFFDIFHNVSKRSGLEDHVRFEGAVSVECANRSMEIAMVLDNSGSMGGEKLTALKESATDLVNSVYNSLEDSPRENPIRVSIVPFNGAVNVGSEYKSQSWVDYDGINPDHHENFDWYKFPSMEPYGTKWRGVKYKTFEHRLTLFTRLRRGWKGCLEARRFPMNTNDETPDRADPKTVFLPMFAPDEPDNYSRQMSMVRSTTEKATCTAFRLKNNGNDIDPSRQFCVRWTDGHSGKYIHPDDPYYLPTYNDGVEYREGVYIGGSAAINQNGRWEEYDTISEYSFANSYMSDDHNFDLRINDHPRALHNTGGETGQLNRQKWMWKYFRKNGKYWPQVTETSWSGIKRGPNFGCDVQKLTPLTSDRQKVLDELDAMVAKGSTNAAQGAIWGWRTLSQGLPFDQGRSITDNDNKKVMIIMSDGDNSHYAAWGNGSVYSPYGFANNGRIFDGVPGMEGAGFNGTNFRNAINYHLAQTCENAKRDAISIYTIAFGVTDGSSIKTMLEACASPDGLGGKQYYDAGNSAELKETFEDIAAKLSKLTIRR